jgi:hypothetical protein
MKDDNRNRTNGAEYNHPWQRPGGLGDSIRTAPKARNQTSGPNNSAPSALIIFILTITWAVGPGYFIPRLWPFASRARRPLRHKLITVAAHGEKMPRLLRVVFQLLPQ